MIVLLIDYHGGIRMADDDENIERKIKEIVVSNTLTTLLEQGERKNFKTVRKRVRRSRNDEDDDGVAELNFK